MQEGFLEGATSELRLENEGAFWGGGRPLRAALPGVRVGCAGRHGKLEEDLGEGSGCHLVQALQTDVCPSLSSRPATRPPPDYAGFSSSQEHFGGHPESGTHSTPHMFTSKGGITQGVRGQGAQSSWARGRQDFLCPEAALPARPGWGAGGAWLAEWPADVTLLAPLPA